MPGHPDGQNYAIWRAPDFFANTAIHVDSTHPAVGQGIVTNYASVFLNVLPVTCPNIIVDLDWYVDSTLAIHIKNQRWRVPLGSELGIIAPAAGNYAIMTASTTSVAGGTCNISMFPTNTPAQSPRYPNTGNRVQQFNFSVALSSTHVDLLPQIMAGNGYIYAADRNSTGKLTARLVTVDEIGNSLARLISWNTLTAFQAQQFTIDGQALRFEVDNTDAVAAHVVDYFVSVDGR